MGPNREPLGGGIDENRVFRLRAAPLRSRGLRRDLTHGHRVRRADPERRIRGPLGYRKQSPAPLRPILARRGDSNGSMTRRETKTFRTRTRLLSVALNVLVTLVASATRADQPPACIAQYEQVQSLRDAGKLRQAREQ